MPRGSQRLQAWTDRDEGPCPDGALRHGPTDAYGRCPWCRNQVAVPHPAPARYPRSELSEAYAYTYDPDEGARGAREIESLIRSGQDMY